LGHCHTDKLVPATGRAQFLTNMIDFRQTFEIMSGQGF